MNQLPPKLSGEWFSNWAASKSHLANFQSAPELPTTADVVIIGSGFTGASLAYHIAQLNASEDVVMLEARECCSGASGRNGGHLAPNYLAVDENDPGSFHISEEQYKTMAEFERRNFDSVYDLIKDNSIKCGVIENEPRGYFAFHSQEELDVVKKHYSFLSKKGLKLDDVELFDSPESAENVTGLKGIYGALRIRSSPVNPYQLVTSLLESLVDDKKIKLFTHTPVTKIIKTEYEKLQYTVTTKSGSIRARQVILATNAYSADLLQDSGMVKDEVYPVRGQVGRWLVDIEDASHLPLVENKISIALGDDYFSVLPETDPQGKLLLSIVLGGSRRVSPTKEIDIVDDNSINPLISKDLRRIMKRTFGINQQPIEEWTGIMGFTKQPRPYVGVVPNLEFLAVVGFMGHGMPRIFKSSEALVRRYLLEEEWPEWYPVIYRASA